MWRVWSVSLCACSVCVRARVCAKTARRGVSGAARARRMRLHTRFTHSPRFFRRVHDSEAASRRRMYSKISLASCMTVLIAENTVNGARYITCRRSRRTGVTNSRRRFSHVRRLTQVGIYHSTRLSNADSKLAPDTKAARINRIRFPV